MATNEMDLEHIEEPVDAIHSFTNRINKRAAESDIAAIASFGLFHDGQPFFGLIGSDPINAYEVYHGLAHLQEALAEQIQEHFGFDVRELPEEYYDS